jgi:hypothetical protein
MRKLGGDTERKKDGEREREREREREGQMNERERMEGSVWGESDKRAKSGG